MPARDASAASSFSRPNQWRVVLWLLPVAILTGTLTAFFLISLDYVTKVFWQHPNLLLGLPLAGAFVVWIYLRWGGLSDRGTDLLLNAIRHPSQSVPGRMAPLVLFSTLVTHLFGGSAGREGTAVQIGGGVAGGIATKLKLSGTELRLLLMCGMAAGFAAVFGTPLSGAIFSAEAPRCGLPPPRVALPLLLTAWLAHWTCTLLGASHTHYQVETTVWNWSLLAQVLVASFLFGLAARLFATLHHTSKRLFTTLIQRPLFRPVVGGILVVTVALLTDAQDCLGLGVETSPTGETSIVQAFRDGGADGFDWLKKTVLTVLTVSSGFKGGEVTPLFFVGSTLGNAISHWMSAPTDLLAALGFISLFAAASKTPLACTVMGMELFGTGNLFYYAVACFVARFVSGSPSIYSTPESVADRSSA